MSESDFLGLKPYSGSMELHFTNDPLLERLDEAFYSQTPIELNLAFGDSGHEVTALITGRTTRTVVGDDVLEYEFQVIEAT